MTLLNISLCLPALDVCALQQKHSIIAVTKRFIAPGKSFALLPCGDRPNASPLASLYQDRFLTQSGGAEEASMPINVTHWAQANLCQQVTDESAIATIADRTIWTAEFLRSHLHNHERLFLSFLQVYELPEALSLETEPACEQLYKFMPLPSYVEATMRSPVLSAEEFAIAKEHFLTPQEEPQPKPAPGPPSAADILNSPDWASKITEVGNSSDGYLFEKLVRKALLELGFSNTLNEPAASLDPYATGGAGGLDLYADQPFPIVGECKATQTAKVGGGPATQLHKLGLKILPKDEYERCIKLIFAAGSITSHAEKTAIGHEMNVILPSTLQALAELKAKYEDAIELSDLVGRLQRPPFGTAADSKVKDLIQQWESDFQRRALDIQQIQQVLQSVEELSVQTIHKYKKAFTPVEIRAHHNAKFTPCLTDEAVQNILKLLISPVSGCLKKKTGADCFSFVKSLP
ncbi:MAG: DUF1802 family protein [Cyanobacteria bacterium J06555_13]